MLVARRALIVTHVPFERPHRIADALTRAGFELDECRPLAGDPLPPHDELAAAVFMGGPMGVGEVDLHPGLADEVRWIAEANLQGLPLLGVCLGSQLLAHALGAAVTPGERPEIGWGEVTIHDPDDPLLGRLAPRTEVLHWHADVFDLPEGCRLLASSELTPVQAFRAGNAWGLLFHAEADHTLVRAWLVEPSMRAQAEAAPGDGAAEIESRAEALDAGLRARTDPVFDAFAALAAELSSG